MTDILQQAMNMLENQGNTTTDFKFCSDWIRGSFLFLE